MFLKMFTWRLNSINIRQAISGDNGKVIVVLSLRVVHKTKVLFKEYLANYLPLESLECVFTSVGHPACFSVFYLFYATIKIDVLTI